MGLCGVLLGVIRVEGLADPNVLWGTRDGLDILSSGHLPRADAWSWTVAGRHWIPNSWGWDVVLGSIHRLGGATALGLLNLVLIMVLVLGMARAAFRLGACGLAVVATIGALGGAILMPWANGRLQIISYVVILGLVPWVRPTLLTTRRGSSAHCWHWRPYKSCGSICISSRSSGRYCWSRRVSGISSRLPRHRNGPAASPPASRRPA